MYEQRSALLRLILLRFLLICLIIVAAKYALPGEQISRFLWPYFLGITGLTGLFLFAWHYSSKLNWLYELQFYADLVLLSSLIYFSGGINSLFIPLFILIIVYASLFRGQRGGMLSLTLSTASCILLVQLQLSGQLPGSEIPTHYQPLVYRFSVTILAFLAVAFLGTTLSQRLRSAGRRLDTALGIQENIIHSIRSGLLTMDCHGIVNFCNRVGATILGVRPKDLGGRPISGVFSLEVWKRLRDYDYLESSRALRLEEWITTTAGVQVCIGMGCSPLLTREQKRIGYIVSFQDLTEIKKREEDYQLGKKMAALGEMAAGLAHELRNPLGSLSGSIQILKSELALSRDQSRLLEIVLRESERLNRIVEDFLAFARPQSTSRERVDLGSLVRETAALLANSREFISGKHSLDMRLGAGRLECKGNADQLKQMVWNIFHNGVRAMPDGGRIHVELLPGDEMILLQVRDDGIGMSPAVKEKLFQPFQSGFPGGSGLGMALVYRIIQEHHGRIEVESAEGQGTRIDIVLPNANNDAVP